MLTVDLNCDMGEGFPADPELMPWISSANIACTYHAGDEALLEKTLLLAKKHGVAAGAHPSYADKAHFGRLDWWGKGVTEADVFDLVCRQLDLFKTVCQRIAIPFAHVKPHGALYNRAADTLAAGEAICRAIKEVAPRAMLFGLAGSEMARAAANQQVFFVAEGFADRRYQSNGRLLSRREAGALLENANDAVEQGLRMLQEGKVISNTGAEVNLQVDTICIHGDGAGAVDFARSLHTAFLKYNIHIQSPHNPHFSE